MRYGLLLLFSGFVAIRSGAQPVQKRSCRTNVELEVVIDTLYTKPDSSGRNKKPGSATFVDYGAVCNPSYQLRARNSNYQIIGFTLEAEDEEGYINTVQTEGDKISCVGKAAQVISRARKGEPVYIYCIKARHSNGNLYILRDFSIRPLR